MHQLRIPEAGIAATFDLHGLTYWSSTMLKQEEKRSLLQIARRAIEMEETEQQKVAAVGLSEVLKNPRGAFVTIRVGGKLRGCIGYIETEKPLATVVEEVARKAAFDDPRFSPITPAEFPESLIEISVLSHLTRVDTPDEIEIGKHGLMIESGIQRGLLLPQVAIEHQLDREGFLAAVARKAGLPPGSPSALLYRFTAEIFDEAEPMTHA